RRRRAGGKGWSDAEGWPAVPLPSRDVRPSTPQRLQVKGDLVLPRLHGDFQAGGLEALVLLREELLLPRHAFGWHGGRHGNAVLARPRAVVRLVRPHPEGAVRLDGAAGTDHRLRLRLERDAVAFQLLDREGGALDRDLPLNGIRASAAAASQGQQ